MRDRPKVKEIVPADRLEQLIGTGSATSAETHDMAVEILNHRTAMEEILAEQSKLRVAEQSKLRVLHPPEVVPKRESESLFDAKRYDREFTLGIEGYATNPPRPTGIGVFLEKKLVGFLTLEEFRTCVARLEQLEAKSIRPSSKPTRFDAPPSPDIAAMQAEIDRLKAELGDPEGVIAHAASITAVQDAEIDRLREAINGISDDYMTSEKHHPGYVLIPTKKFEAIRAAIAPEEGL